MPDFSIIIPSYNQGQFLGDCLDSLISQRRDTSLEIILIDNNSNDCTSEVISRYSAHIDNAVIESDDGQSNAINKGLALATGKYINWLCCDDVLAQNALFIVKKAFEAEADRHVVCGVAEICQEVSRIGLSRSSRLASQLPITLAFSRMVQPATFWRRRIFVDVAPLDENLHFVMDLDLWIRYLASYGSSHVTYIDSILCRINLHESCKTIKHAKSFRQEIDLVVDRLITACTASDGSFNGFNQRYASSGALRTEIERIKRAHSLVNSLKSPLAMIQGSLIRQAAANAPSLLNHLISVRPEVLKMYA